MGRLVKTPTKTCAEEFAEESRNSGPGQWNNPDWHTSVIASGVMETTCGDEDIQVKFMFANTFCSVTVFEKFGSVWCQLLYISSNGHCSKSWPRIKRFLFGAWKKELLEKINKEVPAHARGKGD